MTLRSIEPAGGNDFRLEVASGKNTPGYTITVNMRPAGVAVPELWQEVFRRNVRRSLLLQGIGVKVQDRDRIVRQCLANATLREALIGKHGAWAASGMSGDQGIAKLKSWGIAIGDTLTEETPPPSVNNSTTGERDTATTEHAETGTAASRHSPQPVKEEADSSRPAVAPSSSPTNNQGWLTWLLGIVLLGAIAGGSYAAVGSDAPSPTGVTERGGAEQSAAQQDDIDRAVEELMAEWTSCVQTAQNKPLQQVMDPADYKIQKEICRQRMEAMVIAFYPDNGALRHAAKGWFRKQLEVYSKYFPGTAILTC